MILWPQEASRSLYTMGPESLLPAEKGAQYWSLVNGPLMLLSLKLFANSVGEASLSRRSEICSVEVEFEETTSIKFDHSAVSRNEGPLGHRIKC